jgi:hypothetical protein
VLASGAVNSAAGTETSLGISRHTLANQLRRGDTSFLHLDQHLPAAGGARRAVITVGAAPERGTFRISSTSHAAVAVECYCFKSSSGVHSVVASSELGDDLAEPIGYWRKKADVGQPLHRTVAPERGGHIADGSAGSVGFCCHVKINSFSPLQQNPTTSSAQRLKGRLVGGDHSQVPSLNGSASITTTAAGTTYLCSRSARTVRAAASITADAGVSGN